MLHVSARPLCLLKFHVESYRFSGCTDKVTPGPGFGERLSRAGSGDQNSNSAPLPSVRVSLGSLTWKGLA